MEPLDPELQSLVAAERREVEPTFAERERVAKSLARRVGGGFGAALGLMTTKAAGAAAVSSSVGLALKLSVALLLAGTAALVVVPRLTQREARPAPAARSASPTPSHTATLAQTETAPLMPPPEPPAKTDDAPGPARGSPAARPLPPLAEEARLLKQAQQALRAGEPQVALASLAEHQRRFPQGQLALERNAARLTALCALGHTPQTLSEARTFLQQHPQSGLSQQVRASCGLASENR
jgi:predicted lipid-binding transport protein (Tim44 family)